MIESQGDFNRPWLVGQFGTEILPAIPDVHERLLRRPAGTRAGRGVRRRVVGDRPGEGLPEGDRRRVRSGRAVDRDRPAARRARRASATGSGTRSGRRRVGRRPTGRTTSRSSSRPPRPGPAGRGPGGHPRGARPRRRRSWWPTNGSRDEFTAPADEVDRFMYAVSTDGLPAGEHGRGAVGRDGNGDAGRRTLRGYADGGRLHERRGAAVRAWVPAVLPADAYACAALGLRRRSVAAAGAGSAAPHHRRRPLRRTACEPEEPDPTSPPISEIRRLTSAEPHAVQAGRLRLERLQAVEDLPAVGAPELVERHDEGTSVRPAPAHRTTRRPAVGARAVQGEPQPCRITCRPPRTTVPNGCARATAMTTTIWPSTRTNVTR